MNARRYPLSLARWLAFLPAILLYLATAPAWADGSWKRFPTDAEIEQAWVNRKAELDASWTYGNLQVVKYHDPVYASDPVEASGVLILYDRSRTISLLNGYVTDVSYFVETLRLRHRDRGEDWEFCFAFVPIFRTSEKKRPLFPPCSRQTHQQVRFFTCYT